MAETFYGSHRPVLVPEISDSQIEEMLAVLTPIKAVMVGPRHRFRTIEVGKVDRRETAYNWSPELGRLVRVYPGGLNCVDILTFHRCGYPGFFKPSLAETLACIRLMCPWWKDARFFCLQSDEMDSRNVIAGGTHHWCPCQVYGPEDEGMVDPVWFRDAVSFPAGLTHDGLPAWGGRAEA